MEKRSTNAVFKIGKAMVLVALAGLLLACWQMFYEKSYGKVDFLPTNYSAPILSDQPLTIVLKCQKSGAFQLNIQPVVPETATSEVHYTLTQAKGDETIVLAQGAFTPQEHLYGALVQIELPPNLQKKETCYLTLTSQETVSENGIRLSVGETTKPSDVVSWSSGDEPQPYLPDVTFIYESYNVTSLVKNICVLLLIAFVLFFPIPATAPSTPPARWWAKWYPVVKKLCGIGLFVGAPLPVLWWVETLAGNRVLGMPPGVVLANLLLYWAIELVVFAVVGHSGVAVMAMTIVGLAGGTVNFFIKSFRGTVFIPADLYGLGTAAAVADGYPLFMNRTLLYTIFIAVLLCSCALRFPLVLHGRRKRVGALVVCMTLGCAATYAVIENKPFDLGTRINLFDQNSAVKSSGFLANFVRNIPIMRSQKPEGYAAENLEALVPPAQGGASEDRPNIIVVMNESFTDVRTLLNWETNQEVLPYLRALTQDEAAHVGQVAVPVLGGGTCCSEFEMLTGTSLYVDSTKTAPYMQLFKQPGPALPWQMQALGYHTLSLHLQSKKNWYRDNAYPNMGFETMVFEENMMDSLDAVEYIRSYPSDASHYMVVLDALEQTEEPLFCFALTMQNHGGYAGSFQRGEIQLTNVQGQWVERVNEYLSLLHISDAALEDFFEALSQVDEPTVVLFFGDHWSGVGETELVGSGLQPDKFTAEQTLAYHSTPYVLWSNYGVDFSDAPAHTSTNYLSTLLLDQLNLPLSGWNRFLKQGMAQYPVFSLYGVQQAADASLPLETYTWEYACLQYNMLVDEKKRVASIFEG